MGNLYFDEEKRYRKTEHTTVISVQNIVTSKHATYLEIPPLGFEPRFGFLAFYYGLVFEKLVPGDSR